MTDRDRDRDRDRDGDEPRTLREVDEHRVYRLAVAARLLGVHPETVVRHGAVLLPKPYRTSPLRLLGGEILRLAGVREVDRAGRSAGPGETEADRVKRAADAAARLRKAMAR